MIAKAFLFVAIEVFQSLASLISNDSYHIKKLSAYFAERTEVSNNQLSIAASQNDFAGHDCFLYC